MRPLINDEREWVADAACRNEDTNIFFPTKGEDTAGMALEAKRICSTCPVRVDCLEWAISTRQTAGIWGMMTTKERRRLVRERRKRRQGAA